MDNKFGHNVNDTDPTAKPGVTGGTPLRAAPKNPHRFQKESHEVGANPTAKATSDSNGKVPAGCNGPSTNGG